MSRTAHLRLPFFDAQHRAFAEELDQWTHRAVADALKLPYTAPEAALRL